MGHYLDYVGQSKRVLHTTDRECDSVTRQPAANQANTTNMATQRLVRIRNQLEGAQGGDSLIRLSMVSVEIVASGVRGTDITDTVIQYLARYASFVQHEF